MQIIATIITAFTQNLGYDGSGVCVDSAHVLCVTGFGTLLKNKIGERAAMKHQARLGLIFCDTFCVGSVICFE